MYQFSLLKKFWSYVMLHAIYLISKLSSPVTGNKISFELLNNHVHNLLNLKVFIRLCFSYIIKSKR